MSAFYLFSVRGIPVHMSPWFALFVAWVGWRNGDLVYALMFGVVLFISLLVHELGHALTARRYGLQPAILLHGMGGLTTHRSAPSRKADVFVTAAGPGAGLSLALLSVLTAAGLSAWAPQVLEATRLGEFLLLMTYVNVFWNVLNLVPMQPLDGGKLFEHAVRKALPRKPATVARIVHGVGMAVAALGVLWGATSGMIFVLLLSAYFGYQNFTALRAVATAGPSRTVRKATSGVLAEAEAALAAGKHREAARLGHLARAEAGLDEKGEARARAVIVVASSESGQHADAVRFFRLAPKNAATVEAAVSSLLALGNTSGAADVLAEHGGALPEARRDALKREAQ
jgi:Zn-dependent protease